jgi:UDP-4-amino-4,6-dideoxy-N-acetyl-beta-L-altrosamine transaminase
MQRIPYGRQDIREDDIAAVRDVLQSEFLTQGPKVPEFEAVIGEYCSVPNVVAVSSATAALHIACLALGLGPGDLLWTSPNSFVASANCARYCGAQVDFVDIDAETYNMSVQALAEKLAISESLGKLPKIVIPVHFAGEPCDMKAIWALARKYGFRVIEDASHAIGATYGEDKIGGCRFSDITVFSFHPVKIVTTAEGGALTTRDADVAKSLRRLRSHGITRDPVDMSTSQSEAWYYEQLQLGFNYRMTDLHAALGISQFRRLEDYVSRRQLLASRYDAGLGQLPLQLPKRSSGSRSALHLYPVCVNQGAQFDRNSLYRVLRSEGVDVNVHYIPIHTQPYYKHLGFSNGMFPVSEHYAARTLTLPLFPALRENDQDRVIELLKRVLS